MPSIPQSLLWISLVVLWLFVLVPMLISKRDAVRRTSDVALATRVLNRAGSRLLRRTGPAAGHLSDPDWQPDEEDEYADLDDPEEDDAAVTRPTVTVAVAVAAKVEVAEPDYLDVDVIDADSGALPAGHSAQLADSAVSVVVEPAGDHIEAVVDDGADETSDETEADAHAHDDGDVDDVDDDGDEYEYVEDTSGLEPGEDPPTTVTAAIPRRRRYNTQTAAAVSARKYRFRKRTVLTLAAMLAGSAALASLVAPSAWWLCTVMVGVTMFYLAYLRRQTRIEDRLRRRRMQRAARSRLGVENTHDHEFDVVPSRLRRPGAVVLEIDEEDPSFEHLDCAPLAREYDLPRAAGQ